MMDSEQDEIRSARMDPRNFGVLYERHFAAIFRFILRRAQDRELTADLAQQTFLKAMLGLHRYEPRGLPFRAWLYRIALNELRMFWRKRREVCIDLAHNEALHLSDEVGVEHDDGSLRRLAACLGRLDRRRAQLIELRYMDGLSFAELGQVLGIGEDAAKMRTHRALGTLRNYLDQYP
jgi:RNA polymerase sigma-70 factor (ECF subfamily)